MIDNKCSASKICKNCNGHNGHHTWHYFFSDWGGFTEGKGPHMVLKCQNRCKQATQNATVFCFMWLGCICDSLSIMCRLQMLLLTYFQRRKCSMQVKEKSEGPTKHFTRCSAIAERPHCRVRCSFRQKQNTRTGRQ